MIQDVHPGSESLGIFYPSRLPDPGVKKAGIRIRNTADFDDFFSTVPRSNVWPKGHAATDFPRWRTATLPYQVSKT
jgi:hypothetical protein